MLKMKEASTIDIRLPNFAVKGQTKKQAKKAREEGISDCLFVH